MDALCRAWPGLETFSPNSSSDAAMPSWFMALVAAVASSSVAPATKRRDTFCPIEERSAKPRTRRLSDSPMNSRLNTDLLRPADRTNI